MLTIPMMYKIPMFTSATCNCTVLPKMGNEVPHGITALVIVATIMAIPGPKMNNHFSAFLGIISSLNSNLPPSANGCKSPKGPTLFGPKRSWKKAAIFRSPNVKYKAITKVIARITTMRINFSKNNALSMIAYALFNNGVCCGASTS